MEKNSDYKILVPVSKTDEVLKFEDFHKHYEVVFVDPSGYLNICAKMSKSIFSRVKHEASVSLGLLNSENFNSFDALFIHSHSVEIFFDALVK